jgi:hypothetical protein
LVCGRALLCREHYTTNLVLLLTVVGCVDADEDDNIWDEETTDETLRTEFEDGKRVVLCGTMNQLVRFLTNEENYGMRTHTMSLSLSLSLSLFVVLMECKYSLLLHNV